MDHLEKSFPIAHCPMLIRPDDMADDSINVMDLLRDLWRGKWIIFIVCLLAGALAAYMAFMVLPKTFRAEATLQPAVQSESGGVGKLLGNLPLPLNIATGGESSKVTGMVNFLKSKALAERLIRKYDLLPIFYEKMWDADKKTWIVDGDMKPTVVKALQTDLLSNFLSVKYTKETSLITLAWLTEDPVFAAEMLNRVIDELKNYLDNEYVSDARREREFVERQLQDSTKELEYWEGRIPSATLTQSKISRELLAAQTVYAELRRQLALSQIAETRDVIRFKTLDQPYVPELKYGPKRFLLVAGSVFGAGFLASLLILARSLIRGKAKTEKVATAAGQSEAAL